MSAFSTSVVRVPSQIQSNAWSGEGGAAGQIATDWRHWARSRAFDVMDSDLFAEPADVRNCRDTRVGWGVVLVDDTELADEQLARADDAPQPIARLLAAREGIVLRYASDGEPGFLRRYYANQSRQDIDLAGGAPEGTAPGALPRYLLIYGSPSQIPWDLQYQLNAGRAVGRLDLDGDALERYVEAAVHDWRGASARRDRVVVWAVDHGVHDITRLLRGSIAKPLYERLAADPDVGDGATYLTDDKATGANLAAHLLDRSPGLVVTTSHGMTGPLDDVTAMAAHLGVPVDTTGSPLRVEDVGAWDPYGAMWLAHACCSAGADGRSAFEGLFDQQSEVADILFGVTQVGPQVAPLPRLLLGAERPARAFIGHVEPTFDWTLRQPRTGQFLTSDLTEGLYEAMFQRRPLPVGVALQRWFNGLAELAIAYDQERRNSNLRQSPLDYAMWCQLAIRDRSSLVIYGDPVAAFSAADVAP